MTNLSIDHIVRTPGICGGRPRISRKAISVQFIAALYKNDWTPEQIADEYELTFGEVYAALSYYFDHRDEIDQSTAEDAETIVNSARSARELLEELRARKSAK
jgi:uncharacterized protein (DUF433 family)